MNHGFGVFGKMKKDKKINDEKEYWIEISRRCYRKYEYLIDKIAYLQSENKNKKKES